jgi:DeoR/GlpR family transcriptional regulator of sugar metabolism
MDSALHLLDNRHKKIVHYLANNEKPLTINRLSEKVEMSWMTCKTRCDYLEKLGFLEKTPKPRSRNRKSDKIFLWKIRTFEESEKEKNI